MTKNPFDVIKAEEFNHGLDQLASLMYFKDGLAGTLLSSSNVFLDGSRGSGKSMYLRLLSIQAKTIYEQLATQGKVEPLPEHNPFLGIYVKLAPTLFGPHEYEQEPEFIEAFREFFNVYAMECVLQTMVELDGQGVSLGADRELVQKLSSLALCSAGSLEELWEGLRDERRLLRQQLNKLPYEPSQRAQPEVLWEFAEVLSGMARFEEQRVHLLVDEYDNLSERQQQILNTYLRKRDFPLTFKIACKKHRLVTDDVHKRPLNPSGDYAKVQLDDEGLGLGGSFSSYVEAIGNKRLKNVGLGGTIKDLLGKKARRPKSKGERRYGGFEHVVVLSSGIVRTFLELCRDIYSQKPDSSLWPVAMSIQDEVVKVHASNRWNTLSTDNSARPELQRLIEQIARLFKKQSEVGSEKQIIRLEIVDFDEATTFLRELLETALEYEALVKPNRERLQKNRGVPSRGYLLHRLLCVHFRLEPESRWDFEISSENLQRLVTQPDEATSDILKNPTRRRAGKDREDSQPLFPPHCPILDDVCPKRHPRDGKGFLSCRLPQAGTIRDAVTLLRQAFESAESSHYRLLTAEDYPPSGDISCKVCSAVAESEFVLVELSRFSPSVAMELGFCLARGIPTYLLFNKDEQKYVDEPFSSLEYLSYSITPNDVKRLVEHQIIPFLKQGQGRKTITLGSTGPEPLEAYAGVFIALPDDSYSQETLLPPLREYVEKRGLKVQTQRHGSALQDLQRAIVAIAESKYCIIDTTFGNPVRAMYLGMALGYGKSFANLVNRSRDPEATIFTNARSKSVFDYRDQSELIDGVKEFLVRLGADR